MDARQLRYFVAVAEALNFRRAADLLHVAQPALSRQVQSLERSLRVQLLERDKHHVRLTSAGQAVLEQSRTILQQLDDLAAVAQEAAKGETGALRVGYISLVAYELLPSILRRFRAIRPRAEISLVEFLVMDQYDALLQHRMDVAILRPLLTDPDIETCVFHRAPFVVALPHEHPLTARKTLTVGALHDEDFITLPPRKGGPCFREQVMRFCRHAGFEPTTVRSANDSQAMIGQVAAGMGVAILPDYTRYLRTMGVEYRPLTDVAECADIAVAWRKRDTNPLIAAFVAEAVAAFQEPVLDAVTASPSINDGIGPQGAALTTM